MFVDDLKVYALGAKALGQSLKVVERITTAIGMRIGAQKCATACLRKGKRTNASDYSITEDVIKALVDGQTYKYLGIHQTIRSDPKKVRRALVEVYKCRLHQIWKAQMSGRTKSMQPTFGQYLSSGTTSVVHSSGPTTPQRALANFSTRAVSIPLLLHTSCISLCTILCNVNLIMCT